MTFLVKYLVTGRMNYLKQRYEIILNQDDVGY